MAKKARKRRNKKLRRKNRAVIKHGPNAAREHKNPAGRKGKVHAKRTPASRAGEGAS